MTVIEPVTSPAVPQPPPRTQLHWSGYTWLIALTLVLAGVILTYVITPPGRSTPM